MTSRKFVGDVDGDGKDDIIAIHTVMSAYEYTSPREMAPLKRAPSL